MPNLEWEVPHQIVSPEGTLDLNVPDPVTGRIYRIQPGGYKILPSLRVTQDNVSQADGSVLHPRWKTGMVATMQVGLQIQLDPDVPEYQPACAADLREMDDELSLHLNALRRLLNVSQRLLWTPTGYGQQRMLTDVQTLAWPDPAFDGPEALLSFSLEGPFPYAIDATETQTVIGAGTTGATINNLGNAAFSPVVKVYGPTSAFVLINNDDVDNDNVPLEISYDSTRPGGAAILAGHYAEIDFFRGTIYLDGTGASLIAGIDPTVSDFWRLVPGLNDVVITGATCTVLWNNAWC